MNSELVQETAESLRNFLGRKFINPDDLVFILINGELVPIYTIGLKTGAVWLVPGKEESYPNEVINE